MQPEANDLPLRQDNLPPEPSPAKRMAAFAMALCAAAAIITRWTGLNRESFWFDEGYTAWAISLPWKQLVRAIAVDVSPPLYYLLLKLWAMVLGDSPAALRAFSAVCGSGAIVLFYLIARRVLKGLLAPVVAMGFLGLTIMQTQYSQEARSYELVTLLCLGMLYSLLVFVQTRSRGSLVAFILCAAAGVWTHNMTWFYILTLLICWLVLPSGDDDATAPAPYPLTRRLLHMAVAIGIVVLSFLPWVPSFLGQMRRVHDSFWASAPTAWDFTMTLDTLAGVKPRYPAIPLYAFPRLGDPEGLMGVAVMVLILAITLVGIVRSPARAARRSAAIATFVLAPLALVFAYSYLGRPLFIERVFVPSSACFPILLALPLASTAGAGTLGKRLPRAAYLILFPTMMLMSINGFQQFERKENWRDLSAYLLGLPPRPRLIVFAANEGQSLFDYYCRQWGTSPGKLAGAGIRATGLPSSFYDVDPPVTTRRIEDADDLSPLAQALDDRQCRQIVLVVAHGGWADPKQRAYSLLASRCRLVSGCEFEGFLKVFVFEK